MKKKYRLLVKTGHNMKTKKDCQDTAVENEHYQKIDNSDDIILPKVTKENESLLCEPDSLNYSFVLGYN